MTLTPEPFKRGDTVRVLSHNPHGSRLLQGDEVVVERVKRDEEDRTVLLVRADHGLRAVYDTDVEIVEAVYRPAVPNEEIDQAFADIFAADEELTAIFRDADVALGAVEEDLSPVLTDDEPATAAEEDEDEDVDGFGVIRFTKPADDPTPVLTITDPWDDSAVFVYQEAKAHGRVFGRIMVWTDSEAGVSIRAHLPDLIEWLQEKHDRTASAE